MIRRTIPQTNRFERAARDAWAWTDDDEPGRLPRRVSYPIVAALSLALGAVVLGLSFIGWPAVGVPLP